MTKAARYIKLADGTTYNVGDTLPEILVWEFERLSPHLLECYVELNGRYFKRIKGKLVPHYDVLAQDLVEVKIKPIPEKVKPKKKK